ncbi:FkbM family methyltransferase [Geminocystis sp. CENA526]|uniref:FkbM family methyltransferase n=1 Tax=Geminocystis sp. CENA526 TaxID=1355871 RepID=UPI003D6E1AD2
MFSKLFTKSPNAEESQQLLKLIATEKCKFTPRQVDKPLVLYGAGNLGQMAKEYCDLLKIPIEFVVDSQAETIEKQGFWQGVKVVHPQTISSTMKNSTLLAVCVVTSPYTELETNLKQNGWSDIVPFYDITEFYCDRHPLSNGWFAPPFTEEDIEKTNQVLNLWEDNISRGHHLQFLAWRRLRTEWYFKNAPVTTHDRFFIPEILSVIHDQESFLDVGSHTGSVTKRFYEIVKGKFKAIWAIEPDIINLSNLKTTISQFPAQDRDKIHILNQVVGSTSSECNFYQGLGYTSQCSPLGEIVLHKQTIDELNLSPTFIKLHLEGWELDTLKGAKKTIEQNRPIIVATSYHNLQGIWELPQWLMTQLLDYKFYMRVHSWCGTGAVIYCIPCERR